MALIASVKEKVAEVRERRPFIDHVVRMVEHYGNVNGSALAAAVTYFAFLSFFPILALAFAVIGLVSKAYPDADRDLETAINGVLPNLVGGKDGLDLSTFQENAPGILSVGLLLALYSGLGWLSGMRTALVTVFEEPEREQPSFVVGKVRDVLALLTLGSVLIVSVAVSGVATKIATPILDFVGLGVGAKPLLWVLALVLGLAASALLFFAFFKLLASPNVPSRSLWSGAVLGAVAFELLKQLSTVLLQATREQPAVQAFGIALILVVWINYFSRVVVYAAAWAHTSPEARAAREASLVAEQTVEGPRIDLAAAADGVRASAPASSALRPLPPRLRPPSRPVRPRRSGSSRSCAVGAPDVRPAPPLPPPAPPPRVAPPPLSGDGAHIPARESVAGSPPWACCGRTARGGGGARSAEPECGWSPLRRAGVEPPTVPRPLGTVPVHSPVRGVVSPAGPWRNRAMFLIPDDFRAAARSPARPRSRPASPLGCSRAPASAGCTRRSTATASTR